MKILIKNCNLISMSENRKKYEVSYINDGISNNCRNIAKNK